MLGRLAVKYVQHRYGESVHRAWADHGLAPRLLACKPLLGPWLQVIMEELRAEEGWVPLILLFLSKAKQDELISSAKSATWAFMVSFARSLEVPQLQRLKAHVVAQLARAHQVPLSALPPGDEELQSNQQHVVTGVHGDARTPNVLVQVPLDSQLLQSSGSADDDERSAAIAAAKASGKAAAAALDPCQLPVRFIDFDWAGPQGTATYPDLLHPKVPWPQGVTDGALIKQEHDVALLQASMEGKQGDIKVWPWGTDPHMGSQHDWQPTPQGAAEHTFSRLLALQI